MAASPTQRTLAHLRKHGYPKETTAIVERWNHFAKVRQDLFGVVDVLAVSSAGLTVAIQVTSYTNASARRKKITEAACTPLLLAAGWKIVVHGWQKQKNGRYRLHEWVLDKAGEWQRE